MLLSFENVTFGYSKDLQLKEVSFALHEGEKVGLVGGNGEGKTTLLRLALQELFPDEGTIFQKAGLKIGYLPQLGGFESSASVYGAMEEVFREDELLIQKLSQEEEALSKASEGELAVLSSKIESLHRKIASRDSYHFDVKIKTVLFGMGFEEKLSLPVSSLSGGEKTRLKLAKLLLEEPELLILDEPTNHLDLKTLFWLEDYLSLFKGALLLVSHDRYFLDRLTQKTLELENKKVTLYRGNYSKYKILKKERYLFELSAYEKQQEEIAKLKTFVEKNIVRATSAKSALSRENKLSRMELLEKPSPPPAPPKFCFSFDEKPYESVIKTAPFQLFAEEKPLLINATFSLNRGEKCALLGENGTGKSTLLRFLRKEGPYVQHGKGVKIAFYDQENADLDPEERVLDAFWAHLRLSQTEARKILARAKIESEDIDKKVKELSGGMKAKLALAILEAKRGNVLFLDEPTNHLDLPAREALEEALKAFEGTILFVSHDRRFIEAVADKIYVIENGRLLPFEGGYEEYLRFEKSKETREKKNSEEAPRQKNYRSKEERKSDERKKIRTKEIEQKLEALEEEEKRLEEEMIASARDYQKVIECSKRLEEIKAEIDSLYGEYETLI